tara:strand:- start:2352 stop:5099 length:2748 start_codon:yes stop_codon:yes gene_type:complete
MESIAAIARNNGWNARVVKNRTNTSIYVYPRTYNFPIPETDTLRIQTFPTAMKIARNQPLNSDDTRTVKQYKSLLDEQVGEIKSYVSEIKQLDDEIESNNDAILKQSIANAEMLNGDISTNLTPFQWNTIFSQVQGRLGESLDEKLESKKEKLVAQAMGHYAIINSPGQIANPEDTFSVRETSGGFKGVFDERGQLLWTFSDAIYGEMESKAQDMLDMELKERIILNSRQMGMSEHQLFAYIYNMDKEAEIESMKESLKWNQWAGWDGSAPPDVELPSMVDLADLVEDSIEESVNLQDNQNDIEDGMKLTASISNAASASLDSPLNIQEVRAFLQATGFDRVQVGSDKSTTSSTQFSSATGVALSQEETELGLVPRDGYTIVKEHYRKLPVYARTLTDAWEDWFDNYRDDPNRWRGIVVVDDENQERADFNFATGQIEATKKKLDIIIANAMLRASALPADHPARKELADTPTGDLPAKLLVEMAEDDAALEGQAPPEGGLGASLMQFGFTPRPQAALDRPDVAMEVMAESRGAERLAVDLEGITQPNGGVAFSDLIDAMTEVELLKYMSMTGIVPPRAQMASPLIGEIGSTGGLPGAYIRDPWLDSIGERIDQATPIIEANLIRFNSHEINDLTDTFFKESIKDSIMDLTSLTELVGVEHQSWRREKDLEELGKAVSGSAEANRLSDDYFLTEDPNTGGFFYVDSEGQRFTRKELVDRGLLPYRDFGRLPHRDGQPNVYRKMNPRLPEDGSLDGVLNVTPDPPNMNTGRGLPRSTPAERIREQEKIRAWSRKKEWVSPRTVVGAKKNQNIKRNAADFVYDMNMMGRAPNTKQIFDYVNDNLRHGATMQALGNILSKDKRFKMVGWERTASMISGSYEVQKWTLTPPEGSQGENVPMMPGFDNPKNWIDGKFRGE